MRSCKANKKQQQEMQYQLQLEEQINDLQCQLKKVQQEKMSQNLIMNQLVKRVEQLSQNNIEETQQQLFQLIADLYQKISQKDEIYETINDTIDGLNDELQNIVQLIKQKQQIDSQIINAFQKRADATQQVKIAKTKEQNKQKDQFHQYMQILAERITDKDKELNEMLNEVQEPKQQCDYRKHLQKYEEQFQMQKHHQPINDESEKIDLVQLVQTELGRVSSPHNSDNIASNGLRLSPINSESNSTPREITKPSLDRLLGKVTEGMKAIESRK